MSEQKKRKIELLAPGGDADSVKAAICAGADAVYCGTASFNARQRAANLSVEELEQLVRIAEQKNCRLYLTLNTLVFDHEIPQILKLLESVYRAGIRVVIVQDLGLLHILKTYLPQIEVHASTQLTTHNAGQISFLSRFGVTQVNLSRELSLTEIRPLCDAAHGKNMKVEVFVHGAFCISFSGQCYLSSFLCGKSGNRGECVQPCRRLYSAPGTKAKTDAKAVFNLKDNSVFSHADSLYNAGVDSLKIEGRIKKFSYVYNVTSAWREQVDALEAGETIRRKDKRLETVFNRKFTAGYVKGRIDADMFIDTSRDQSLRFVANVTRYWADKKILTLDKKTDFTNDTEILVYTPDFTFICKGVLTKKISSFEYLFSIEHKLKGKINQGYQVFTQKSSDSADSIKSMIDELHPEKVPLRITVSGSIGSELKVVFESPRESVTLYSQIPLTAASRRPLDQEMLRSQFERLGTSQFVLEELDASELSEDSFIPQKELNRLRREAVEKLSGITIESSSFEVPPVVHSSSSGRKVKKAYFVYDIGNGLSSKRNCDTTAVVIPNSIHDIEKAAAVIRSEGFTPFFSSIYIGQDFGDAVKLLHKLDGRKIITNNTGIADAASRLGMEWVAGPGFNIANSYAVGALMSIKGFSGFFLSPEFSQKDLGAIRTPSHIDVWQAVNLQKVLMTTRQCLIRNISGCGKKVCDRDCLINCNRTVTVVNSQGKRFEVVKRPG
ncbi:MAG: peptidase U32 family protein, partial [Chitinispirillaceae bacterium]